MLAKFSLGLGQVTQAYYDPYFRLKKVRWQDKKQQSLHYVVQLFVGGRGRGWVKQIHDFDPGD